MSTNGSQSAEKEFTASDFTMESTGLYCRIEISDGKGGTTKKRRRVSDPFEVIGNLCDVAGGSYSLAVSWNDDRARTKRRVVPLALFGGYRNHVIVSSFLEAGLRIEPGMQDKFAAFLWIAHKRAPQMELATRTGWHNGQRLFILPNETIGDASSVVIYDPPADVTYHFGVAGTPGDWRADVSEPCAGNSRLVFAMSLAFAAPLLSLVGAESIGVHLRGGSSKGKTTAQHVAGSVWGGGGGHGFPRSWLSTLNGLEGIAAAHTDSLLVLDEMSQCDPRAVVNAVYLLMNGKGKNRAAIDGSARRGWSWTIALLSSGEVGLAEHSEKKTRGGAEVRLLDIEADAGAGLGLFEDLHGVTSSNDRSAAEVFAMKLRSATQKSYGHAARVFLTRLSELDSDSRVEIIRQLQSESRNSLNLEGATPEVGRVASSLSLIAAAGELATLWGITGWPEGEANLQVKKCFDCWLENRGGKLSAHDDEQAIAIVRQFIEQFGDSRFVPVSGPKKSQDVIRDRVGFRRTADDGGTEYLFLPETFKKEVIPGRNYKTVMKALISRGYARRDGRSLVLKTTVPGMEGQKRFYCVRSSILT